MPLCTPRAPRGAPGVLLRAAGLIALAVSRVSASGAACIPLSVNTTAKLFETAPYFATWNIDPSRDRAFFDIDWADPTIVALATGIGGGRIRFGGTGADALHYGVPGATPCTATIPAVYECLNSTWYNNLQALSTAASSPLIFGINIHPAGGTSPPSGPWNPTNAAALLRAAKAAGQTFFALELGNEQNDNMEAEEQAAAFAVLSSTLDEVYGAGPSPDRPFLVGPDTHSFHDGGEENGAILAYLQDFAGAVAGNPDVRAITHHEYVQIDETNVLDPVFLNTTAAIAQQVIAAVRRSNSSLPIWAGEIGPHNGGTTPNPNCGGNKVCGRFGSAIWYADAMASKATAGYAAFCRQDVLGADYALLNTTTHNPSPDYYLLRLWQQLVGHEVLATEVGGGKGLVRGYGFCSARRNGGVVLLLLNLASTPACVGLPGGATTGALGYSLTAGAGGVESADVLLNGVRLVAGPGGALPPMPGVEVGADGSATLPPQSVSFVVVPKIGGVLCGLCVGGQC